MDKETERMKVDVVASFYMGTYVNMLIMYTSGLVAVIVGLYAAFAAEQIGLLTFGLAAIILEGIIIYFMRHRSKKFKKQVKYLDTLVEKLESNQSVGTFEDILHKAPK